MKKNLFRGAILETVLLTLIKDSPICGLHGYAMLLTMHKKYGVRLGPSSLYPTLNLMEKRGLIESSWEIGLGKPRRQYRITRKGQNQLKEYSAEFKVVLPAFTV
ncbi:MAG: PadR family transcriptional regulator [Candidatus Bathyarchaeota archaeon]|nr:PadR family transcriptional regulator [Candidatus Bathyarchaeota archaeon]